VSEANVREALVDDARAIAKVHTRTWQLAYDHVFPTERLAGIVEERRAEQWHEIIREPEARSHTLVATEVEGEKVVGFASCGPSRDPSADAETVGELYAVYVLPEVWGRGFGRALMQEVLDRLRGDGFLEAMLWVIEDNPRTRRYYERAGWQFDGGVKDEAVLDIHVRQVRYRIDLDG
jgi:GNAT superfamily N-acetyltransferase